MLPDMNLQNFLDQKTDHYNRPLFIKNDPVSIPHRYTKKEDIEISAFLVATIAWGKREQIIKSGEKLMTMMKDSPFDFILNADRNDLKKLNAFYYRTFNNDDLFFFIYALRNLYSSKGGLEQISTDSFNKSGTIKDVIVSIRQNMLVTPHLKRSEKHLADPENGSAAKRINMFLRWMVRKDNMGVDFGLWRDIPLSALMCPLDVHSGKVARKLGLLHRKQNDWKAVEELTTNLRVYDTKDPVKYDYALFGTGIRESELIGY